jgi:hypothetical protein
MSTPSLTATSRAAEDPATYTSLALSAALPPPKISKNEIYQYFVPRVCFVSCSKEKNYTAAFIDKRLVVTTFDVFTKVMKSDGKSWHISSENIQIYYNHQKYPTQIPLDFDASCANHCKIAQLELPLLPTTTDYFESLPPIVRLGPGMSVYFVGYKDPTKLTFHKAMITSIVRVSNVEHFEFDVALLPSYFGGPVVVKIQGKLYLAGLLTRGEGTDPELATLKKSVEALKSTSSNTTLDIVMQTLAVLERSQTTGGMAVHARYIARLVKKFEVSTHP